MLTTLSDWATGGAEYTYHTLVQCFGGDVLLASLTASLGVVVLVAYFKIGYGLYQGWFDLAALRRLAVLFVLCGIASYGWIAVEFFWPGQRVRLVILILTAMSAWWVAWPLSAKNKPQ